MSKCKGPEMSAVLKMGGWVKGGGGKYREDK